MDVPSIPLTDEVLALMERALIGEDAAAKQQLDDLFANATEVVRITVIA